MKTICAAIVLLAVACSFTEAQVQPGDYCYLKVAHESECNARHLQYKMWSHNECQVINPANDSKCFMKISEEKCNAPNTRTFYQNDNNCAIDHFALTW